jgi:hypothetical protein
MHRSSPEAPSLKFNASPRTIGAMRCARRASAALVAGFLCLAAGCHLAPAGGMAERCADIMQRAYPGADIDITKSEAAATSITTILAHVEGVRSNLPPHAPLPRNLAVECRFDGDILTGFRWTAGPTR